MKAYQSPLLKKIIAEPEIAKELQTFLASSESTIKVFVKGKYYTFKK